MDRRTKEYMKVMEGIERGTEFSAFDVARIINSTSYMGTTTGEVARRLATDPLVEEVGTDSSLHVKVWRRVM